MTPRVDRTTISLLFAGVTAIIAVTASSPNYISAPNWSFAVLSGTAWAYLMISLARLRGEHSSAGETKLGRISPATVITIARGFLVSLVAGYAVGTPPGGLALWLPGTLYAVAALADRADGALARRTRTTALGAKLDVTTDAVGLFVAPLVGVHWGRLPPWYLALACAYPAVRGAFAVRRALGRQVFVERLEPNPRARLFAGVQMAVVAASLFPVLPRALTWPVATLAMLPTLALFAGEWRLATRSAPNGGARAQRLDA
jgi:CDP-diacylglycerol--glycerol-3-phosphate 3-phosphatidyltransferase